MNIVESVAATSVPNISDRAKFAIAPGRFVGGDHPCFIIAEIGQNHQGDVEIAKQLIQVAVDCKVDCVKFQKSDLNCRFTKEVLNRRYESINSWGDTYGKHRKKLELMDDEFKTLQKFCGELGIHFTASGMDKMSVDFLNSLNVPFFKIGSADTTNLPFLKQIARYRKPMVISTGMTDFTALQHMYGLIKPMNNSIAFLQCTSSYPTDPQNINLNVIETYKRHLPGAVIGYSGHEVGIEISLAAVALGAKILERHITLDHSMKGSDHRSSLNPCELRNLVLNVRKIEAAMGISEKKMEACELPCFQKLGKTIVTTKKLQRGTIIEEDMIDVKVAVKKGIDPLYFDDIIGYKLNRTVEKEETINFCDFESVKHTQ